MPEKESPFVLSKDFKLSQDIIVLRKMESFIGEPINNLFDEVRIIQRGLSISTFEKFKTFTASKDELIWIIKPRKFALRKQKK